MWWSGWVGKSAAKVQAVYVQVQSRCMSKINGLVKIGGKAGTSILFIIYDSPGLLTPLLSLPLSGPTPPRLVLSSYLDLLRPPLPQHYLGASLRFPAASDPLLIPGLLWMCIHCSAAISLSNTSPRPNGAVARCGLIVVRWTLWVDYCGSVAVVRSLWVGRCGLLALCRLRRRMVTLCRALWVRSLCCSVVVVRSLRFYCIVRSLWWSVAVVWLL